MDAHSGVQTALLQVSGPGGINASAVVGTIDFTSDGRLVAAGVGPGIGIFRVDDGKLVYAVHLNLVDANSVGAVAFSPVRDELIVGLMGGHIESFCGLSAQFGGR